MSRRAQHRDREDKNELSRLRKRNRELEHEVERLTRQLARERKNAARTPVPEDVDPEPQEVAPTTSDTCPQCGSEVKEFATPTRVFRVCTNKPACLWRGTR